MQLYVLAILCVFATLIQQGVSFRSSSLMRTRVASKVSIDMARGEAKVIDENETEEELMERMRKKARKMMFNENGVAYAPWVSQQIDEDAIIKELIRKEKESAEGKAKRTTTTLDRGEIQSSEGMKWRMNDNQVQLSWVTGSEADNQGYIVERRPSYGGEFAEIASFEQVAGLRSAGVTGGRYGYTDPASSTGSWVYRIQDCDAEGKRSVLCQCFVEVTTDSENKAQFTVLVGLVGVLSAAVIAGSLLDPTMQ